MATFALIHGLGDVGLYRHLVERELGERGHEVCGAPTCPATTIQLGSASTPTASYRDHLDNHILPVLGGKRVEDIRPRVVGAFLEHLQDEKGLSAATARKARTVLSAVLSYAVAMEYVESNAAMKVPPPEAHAAERVAPTLEETARILLEAEVSDPDFLTYLWVAAETGGRRGETLALRWGGVDFDAGTISIDGTVSIGDDGSRLRSRTKTSKSRKVAVSSITLDHLRAHRARVEKLLEEAAGEPLAVDPNALVFCGGRGSRRDILDANPWRPDSTSRRFRQLRDRARVRLDIDLHGLRHTMITEMLAAGVDPRTVMGRAGHSPETTTMTVYAKGATRHRLRRSRDVGSAARGQARRGAPPEGLTASKGADEGHLPPPRPGNRPLR